jgi:hypothetical protein
MKIKKTAKGRKEVGKKEKGKEKEGEKLGRRRNYPIRES